MSQPNYRLLFGTYKGMLLSEVPLHYLEWLDGPLTPGMRLLYYDSDGHKDELLWSGAGVFAGFGFAR